MTTPNPIPESNKPRTPSWPINLGIGLATGIILGMLIASWGLRQENWQKAGLETVAAVMLVIVFVITALATFGTAFVRNGFRCSWWVLVIAISIFAVVLVGLELFLEQSRVQRASIAKLTAAGATVYYPPGRASGLAILIGEQYFLDVVLVEWDCSDIPNPDLTSLLGLNGLKYLTIKGVKCPPSDLVSIQALPCLTELFFIQCQFSDESLECMGKINSLDTLNLFQTPINDSGLKELAHNPNLRCLISHSPVITNDGLAHLKNLSNLQVLDLSYTEITNQGLKHLGEISNLTVFGLELDLTEYPATGC